MIAPCLASSRVLENVKEMWTEKAKGKKGQEEEKERVISKMFLRGDSVILVRSSPTVCRTVMHPHVDSLLRWLRTPTKSGGQAQRYSCQSDPEEMVGAGSTALDE